MLGKPSLSSNKCDILIKSSSKTSFFKKTIQFGSSFSCTASFHRREYRDLRCGKMAKPGLVGLHAYTLYTSRLMLKLHLPQPEIFEKTKLINILASASRVN